MSFLGEFTQGSRIPLIAEFFELGAHYDPPAADIRFTITTPDGKTQSFTFGGSDDTIVRDDVGKYRVMWLGDQLGSGYQMQWAVLTALKEWYQEDTMTIIARTLKLYDR